MDFDFGTGDTVYLITDPDKNPWTVTELRINIDNGVKFRISNGYLRKWVFGREIALTDETEPKKVGYKK